MARIRSIKPSFWTDEKLGGLPRDARLLFIGIISALCDDEGRARANPKLIRASVFPYDDLTVAQVSAMIVQLEESQLIDVYEDDGQNYLSVRNFKRHQKIDKRQPSTLPAPLEHSANGRRIVGERSTTDGMGGDGMGRDGNGSLFKKQTEMSGRKRRGRQCEHPDFPECWEKYPKRAGGNSRPQAARAYSARRKDGVSQEAIMAGLERYGAYVRSEGMEGGRFVMLAATFLGPDKRYEESWDIPPAKEHQSAETREDREIEARVAAEHEAIARSQEWLKKRTSPLEDAS